jgi:hypothetical protein
MRSAAAFGAGFLTHWLLDRMEQKITAASQDDSKARATDDVDSPTEHHAIAAALSAFSEQLKKSVGDASASLGKHELVVVRLRKQLHDSLLVHQEQLTQQLQQLVHKAASEAAASAATSAASAVSSPGKSPVGTESAEAFAERHNSLAAEQMVEFQQQLSAVEARLHQHKAAAINTKQRILKLEALLCRQQSLQMQQHIPHGLQPHGSSIPQAIDHQCNSVWQQQHYLLPHKVTCTSAQSACTSQYEGSCNPQHIFGTGSLSTLLEVSTPSAPAFASRSPADPDTSPTAGNSSSRTVLPAGTCFSTQASTDLSSAGSIARAASAAGSEQMWPLAHVPDLEGQQLLAVTPRISPNTVSLSQLQQQQQQPPEQPPTVQQMQRVLEYLRMAMADNTVLSCECLHLQQLLVQERMIGRSSCEAVAVKLASDVIRLRSRLHKAENALLMGQVATEMSSITGCGNEQEHDARMTNSVVDGNVGTTGDCIGGPNRAFSDCRLTTGYATSTVLLGDLMAEVKAAAADTLAAHHLESQVSWSVVVEQ